MNIRKIWYCFYLVFILYINDFFFLLFNKLIGKGYFLFIFWFKGDTKVNIIRINIMGEGGIEYKT